MSGRRDKHHLLFRRKAWNGDEWARRLRNFWYCEVTVPVALHESIHDKLPLGVNPPNSEVCEKALKELRAMSRQGKILRKDPPPKRIEMIISCLNSDQAELIAALRQQLVIFSKKH